jgi:hypothetical protein
VPLLPSFVASPAVAPRLAQAEKALVACVAVGLLMLVGARAVLDGVEVNLRRALGISTGPVTAEFDRRANWVDWQGRSFPYESAERAEMVERALGSVDRLTDPGDSWIVGPSDLQRAVYNETFLYHMLPELEPATYHLVMVPGTADREGSTLPAEIAAADVVLMGSPTDVETILPNSKPGSPDAAAALAARFCVAEQVWVYTIYERCR